MQRMYLSIALRFGFIFISFYVEHFFSLLWLLRVVY